MRMKNKWPTEVPVLTSRDMCKGQLHRGERSCLIGHVFKTFGESKGIILGKVRRALGKRCLQHDADPQYSTASFFNDDHTLTENAKVWNETMADLGYTED